MLKNAYEKEVADIKEKRNNAWFHLALTPDTTNFKLMRHDCVVDDGIGDRAKALQLLPGIIQSVETPTVVTLVNLTQEIILFYLPCSVREFKMSYNSVKPDKCKEMAQKIGSFGQVFMNWNAPETAGELYDVWNVCALAKITKTAVPRVGETQAEVKLERVFTEDMGPFRVALLSELRFCIVFADLYTKFVFVDLFKAMVEALAGMEKFSGS